MPKLLRSVVLLAITVCVRVSGRPVTETVSTDTPQDNPYTWNSSVYDDEWWYDDWLNDTGWNIKWNDNVYDWLNDGWSDDTDDDDDDAAAFPCSPDYVYIEMGRVLESKPQNYALASFDCAAMCFNTPLCKFSFIHFREMACFFAFANQNATINFE